MLKRLIKKYKEYNEKEIAEFEEVRNMIDKKRSGSKMVVGNKMIYEFRSSCKYDVIIEDNLIKIENKSSLLKNDVEVKIIKVESVQGVKFKEWGTFDGYIKFVVKGDLNIAIDGNTFRIEDDNKLMFASKVEENWANEIKEYIENYSRKISFSPADEILKYKNLLDQGAISNSEYENKKKQLLGM